MSPRRRKSNQQASFPGLRLVRSFSGVLGTIITVVTLSFNRILQFFCMNGTCFGAGAELPEKYLLQIARSGYLGGGVEVVGIRIIAIAVGVGLVILSFRMRDPNSMIEE